MPFYRLTPPTGPVDLLGADSARVEASTVLRDTAYVMGRPREVVLRCRPSKVSVEQVER